MRRPLAVLALTVSAVVTLPLGQACADPLPFDTGSVGSGSVDRDGDRPDAPPVEDTVPAFDVVPLIEGLDHPWDVVQAPDGAVLTGQRAGGFVVRRADGSTGPVQADLSDLYAGGETGLMAIALSQDFSQSRKLFTCQGYTGGGVEDVRVVAWTVDPEWTALTRAETVIDGIPLAGGRHGGCRILAAADGTLFVGTGDTATSSVPQDPNSLGGKTLHINADGTPAAGNPRPDSPVYTLGHRNVQGLAQRADSGDVYAVEQGTDRDDEVNLLVPGGNYGYRPDRIPFVYDESVPMTDPVRVPGALGSLWSSGKPTLATASGAFVDGSAWGPWDGSLVIGGLKSKQLLFLRLSDDGRTVTAQGSGLNDRYGRLRSVTPTGDGALLVTTDNGDADQVLRVTPRP